MKLLKVRKIFSYIPMSFSQYLKTSTFNDLWINRDRTRNEDFIRDFTMVEPFGRLSSSLTVYCKRNTPDETPSELDEPVDLMTFRQVSGNGKVFLD